MDRPDTREWLTTNGLGGYASGTAGGANTRRYHGLPVAALEPPGRRTVLLSRLDKAHDLDNLYVVDASFFPSSSSVHPSLTTIANALRVGDRLLERLGMRRRELPDSGAMVTV
jgi:glycogen debranching enzyme